MSPSGCRDQKGSAASLVPGADDIDQQDTSLLEQSSEEHQGLGLHSPLETSKQVVSGDGVNVSSNHFEPDNIQDIVLEAQHRASFQVTLNRLWSRL